MWKSLKELAELVSGDINGDSEVKITGVADIAEAETGDIVFAEAPKYIDEAEQSKASAIIAFKGAANSGKPKITVDNPRYAFASVLQVFSPEIRRELGIHRTAAVGKNTKIGENPSIGSNAFIGENCNFGKNVTIYPFVYIGDNVEIGDNCILYPFVTLVGDINIGRNVTIHAGTVVGADGFGYINIHGNHIKMPQIGGVSIGDDVEIGANCTIDRARTGTTQIGRGTKIDNLVHIAHNVCIGEDCIIVAQVGISGSVELGNRVVMAGQAGVKDHVKVGNDTIICARSGIISEVPDGSFVSGYPARPHREQMRAVAAIQRLPNLLKQVKELEKRIEELEGHLGE